MQIDFHESERASLGVEMELTLVDRTTRELVSAASAILAEIGEGHPDNDHPKAKHELFECTIEIITGICQTVAEARSDLEETLSEVRAAADKRGLDLICSGSHPFSSWQDQTISPPPRYRELVEDMQWTASRLQIFGIHYHVGVRSAEKSIAIANELTAWLPHFLALSASSPYWERHDTGLASSRVKVFEALPTAGLPPQIHSWEDFEEYVETLMEAQAIRTIREVWWDVRPHPNFGTVELRICDGTPTMHECATLAAMAQTMVTWLDRLIDRGELPRVPREWVVRENKWLAARYGLDAEIIVDDSGTRRAIREEIADLMATLTPIAAELGCSDELAGVNRILEEGPSCERQRRQVAGGATLEDVVDSLVAELATDTVVAS
ncbi:MAG: glutamate--cysteine ligase [Acidimicrobiia bacterium]|nr:glutamate--cysteine ligase [Acidimicrobiia bacterium]